MFGREELFAKSRLFISRALEARDDGNFPMFHLWASMSLELLGKAALASLHPTMVADPSSVESLIAALGLKHSTGARSIIAKTVYSRLRRLVPGFDGRAEELCLLLADRRNEELHSGGLPFVGVAPDSWVPGFWRVAILLLEFQGSSIRSGSGRRKQTKSMLSFLLQ
jgi:hypothetical protein